MDAHDLSDILTCSLDRDTGLLTVGGHEFNFRTACFKVESVDEEHIALSVRDVAGGRAVIFTIELRRYRGLPTYIEDRIKRDSMAFQVAGNLCRFEMPWLA